MKQATSLSILLVALCALPAAAQLRDADAGAAEDPAVAAPLAEGSDADADGDGDGIADATDDCPETPPGSKVLPDGCLPRHDCRKPRDNEPADDKGCAIEQVYTLHGITYEFDSDVLKEEGKATLRVVADAMKVYPELKFELHGHTCWIGSEAYNQNLSERRARSAMRYLVELGIRADRIAAKGFGESKPVDTNETREGRRLNRRTELKVIE